MCIVRHFLNSLTHKNSLQDENTSHSVADDQKYTGIARTHVYQVVDTLVYVGVFALKCMNPYPLP